jgi:hypothetical protein
MNDPVVAGVCPYSGVKARMKVQPDHTVPNWI